MEFDPFHEGKENAVTFSICLFSSELFFFPWKAGSVAHAILNPRSCGEVSAQEYEDWNLIGKLLIAGCLSAHVSAYS